MNDESIRFIPLYGLKYLCVCSCNDKYIDFLHFIVMIISTLVYAHTYTPHHTIHKYICIHITDICTHIQRKNKRGLINYKLVLISCLVIHPVSYKKSTVLCSQWKRTPVLVPNFYFLTNIYYFHILTSCLQYWRSGLLVVPKLSSTLESWLTGGSIPRSHIRQLPMTCISNSSLGVYGHHILIVYRNHEGIHIYTQVKLNE